MSQIFEYKFQTTQKRQMIDIQEQVLESLKKAHIKQGTATVISADCSALISVHDFREMKPGFGTDPDDLLEVCQLKSLGLLPVGEDYHVDFSQTVFVEDGHLQLDRWESIFFMELDGEKDRCFYVRVEEDKRLKK